MTFFLIVQSLAILGLIIWAVSYHFSSRKKILLIQLCSFIFFITHFILLNAYTGAVVAFIAALRLLAFSFRKKNNWIDHPIVPVLFIIITAIFTFITAENFWAIFAFIGGVIAILASFVLDEDKIRRYFVPSHISWIIYDIAVGSYGGAISEFILMLSALSSLFKYKNSKKCSFFL